MSNAKDSLKPFLFRENKIRGVYSVTTEMAGEWQKSHKAGPLESYLGAQALTAATLLSSNLKGNDKYILNLDCQGPLQGFLVEVDSTGAVRGYLKQNPVPLESSFDNLDMNSVFGQGILSLTKVWPGGKQYTGDSILQYGDLAKDLAYFYLVSEQIPAAFVLSVRLDSRGSVVASAGMFLQALPEAEDSLRDQLATSVEHFPSLADTLLRGESPETLISQGLEAEDILWLPERSLRYECSCNKARYSSILREMFKNKKNDLLDQDMPVHLSCQYCGKEYSFSEEEILRLWA